MGIEHLKNRYFRYFDIPCLGNKTLQAEMTPSSFRRYHTVIPTSTQASVYWSHFVPWSRGHIHEWHYLVSSAFKSRLINGPYVTRKAQLRSFRQSSNKRAWLCWFCCINYVIDRNSPYECLLSKSAEIHYSRVFPSRPTLEWADNGELTFHTYVDVRQTHLYVCMCVFVCVLICWISFLKLFRRWTQFPAFAIALHPASYAFHRSPQLREKSNCVWQSRVRSHTRIHASTRVHEEKNKSYKYARKRDRIARSHK